MQENKKKCRRKSMQKVARSIQESIPKKHKKHTKEVMQKSVKNPFKEVFLKSIN